MQKRRDAIAAQLGALRDVVSGFAESGVTAAKAPTEEQPAEKTAEQPTKPSSGGGSGTQSSTAGTADSGGGTTKK
jgi:hypothetical protein